jgi:two-component system, chemotaxis family, protein-glutamate methylesterase/glutaminase
MTASPIRIVIVDDNETTRAVLRSAVDKERDFTAVGEAKSPDDALRLVKRHRPDLVTINMQMRAHGGLDATRAIMAERPTPILVMAADHPLARTQAMRAIEAGAMDVFPELALASGRADESQRRRLTKLMRTLSQVPVVRRFARPPRVRRSLRPEPRTESAVGWAVIAIGASTGGPPVVGQLLRSLLCCPAPIVVVQHMTTGFGEGFAQWLEQDVGRSVVYVEEAARLAPEHVYVAPDDKHLVLEGDGRLLARAGPALLHQRPSIDLFFESVSTRLGARAVGVLLTGMGSDGAEGLRALRDTGALTIAQAPETCVVASMPASAIALGAARLVLAPATMGAEILRLGVYPQANQQGADAPPKPTEFGNPWHDE